MDRSTQTQHGADRRVVLRHPGERLRQPEPDQQPDRRENRRLRRATMVAIELLERAGELLGGEAIVEDFEERRVRVASGRRRLPLMAEVKPNLEQQRPEEIAVNPETP